VYCGLEELVENVTVPFLEVSKNVVEENIDLIVIGSHNPRIFGKLIFGSVSDAVVHKASCPILVLKRQQVKDKT